MSDKEPLIVSQQTLNDLGFKDVESIIDSFCVTPMGREMLQKERFPENRASIESRLLDAMEGKILAAQKVPPPFAAVADLRPLLNAVERGGVLDAKEILQVANSLSGIERLQALIGSREDEIPCLFERSQRFHDHEQLVEELLNTFDSEGRITDYATPDLFQLRERVRNLRQDAQEILLNLIRTLDEHDLLQDKNFTIRNDRYVLPVKASFQGRVPGIVHDASQTGQTVFIEPKEVMNVGNRIKIQMALVLEEEATVLSKRTEQIRSASAKILEDLERIGQLEAAYSRGRWAVMVDGVAPQIATGDQPLSLRNACHPILAFQSFQERAKGHDGDAVVPNDFEFDHRRVFMITGPNAGGKTVALKTAGLIFLLARAGIPVPVDPKSVVPLYGAIFSSLGDEQQLSQGLSRFSGHMNVLGGILDAVKNRHSSTAMLCLLDEPCAGTDSTQGAALAQAILESLAQHGAYVMASTHFERLKTLALVNDEQSLFRNISLALDSKTLMPTFRLAPDQVGRSNAFETAERYGVPDQVIERAREILDPSGQEVQGLLERLGNENARIDDIRRNLEGEVARLKALKEEVEREKERLLNERKRLKHEGLKSLEEEIQSAREIIAKAIDASQKNAQPRALNRLSHALKDEEKRVTSLLNKKTTAVNTQEPAQVRVGDTVSVFGMDGLAFEVLELNDGEAVISKGAMRMRKPLSALKRESKSQPLKTPQTKRVSGNAGTPSGEPKTSDNSIDLRGMRVEEALELLDAFLDSRLQKGAGAVFVLHGHGTGALKKAVRQKSRFGTYAVRARPATKADGGDAWTLLTFEDRVSS